MSFLILLRWRRGASLVSKQRDEPLSHPHASNHPADNRKGCPEPAVRPWRRAANPRAKNNGWRGLRSRARGLEARVEFTPDV